MVGVLVGYAIRLPQCLPYHVAADAHQPALVHPPDLLAALLCLYEDDALGNRSRELC